MDKIQQVDILGIGVHPDDVELSCMGTLLLHKELGYSFGLLDLTQGELGTRGSGPIRLLEAADSARLSGATFRTNLGMADGFFQIDDENLRKVAGAIRQARPSIILANALNDRHPDHGRAAQLVKHAVFLAALPKVVILDQLTMQEIPAWRPQKLYHYIQDYNLVPDFVVDISSTLEQKIDCVMAFKTQFYDPNSTEPQTPISSAGFMDFIRAKASVYGRHADAEYGEGFNSDVPLRVNDLYSTLK